MFWNEMYATGMHEIDEQHKILFLITNRLQTAIKAGKAGLVISKTFQELVDYTRYHFAAEEHEMVSCGYPGLAIHKTFHVALVNNIRKSLLRIRNGDTYSPIELLRFLNVWLVDHILEKDMKFSKFYKQNSSNASEKQMNGENWLSGRLQKLRDLLKRKLIETDVYISEKNNLLTGYISAHAAWTEAELKRLCEMFSSFTREQLLSESEIVEFKSMLSEKVDIGKLIEGKSENEAKGLLSYFQQHKIIISSDKSNPG